MSSGTTSSLFYYNYNPSTTTIILSLSLLPHLTDAGVDWAVRATSSSGEMSIFAFFFFAFFFVFFFFVFFENNFYRLSFSLWPFFCSKLPPLRCTLVNKLHISSWPPHFVFMNSTYFDIVFLDIFHFVAFIFLTIWVACILHSNRFLLIFLCLLLLHFCFPLLSSLSFSILFLFIIDGRPAADTVDEGPSP